MRTVAQANILFIVCVTWTARITCGK